MRNPKQVLNNLCEHSKVSGYRFERLYRNLFNEQMFYVAYQRIYTKQGNMTPGTDGKTIDQMSIQRIESLIASLKNETYQPNPAKRVYITNKRKRKDIPLWRRLLTSDYGVQILSHSRQGFIAFADGKIQNALIYGSSKRSGYHSELNILYIENLLKKFKPKASVSVTWNMGTEADYSIIINGHTISYWDGTWYNDNTTFTSLNELVEFIRNAIDNPI